MSPPHKQQFARAATGTKTALPPRRPAGWRRWRRCARPCSSWKSNRRGASPTARLPMAEGRKARVFDDTLALWEQMHLGYLHCLQAVIDDEPGIRAETGMVCQRALAYTGLKMFHHHRAYRQVPARANGARCTRGYARAEELGVAETGREGLSQPRRSTRPRRASPTCARCCSAWRTRTSSASASSPSSPSCLERWAEKVEISAQAPEEDIPPLVVDLESDRLPRARGRRSGAAQVSGHQAPRQEPAQPDRPAAQRRIACQGSRWAKTACSHPASSCSSSCTASGARQKQPRAAERKARRRCREGLQ